jgi:hypothetical protein
MRGTPAAYRDAVRVAARVSACVGAARYPHGMEDWTEDAAEALDRMTESGLGRPWHGTARILSATDAVGRRRFQACSLELELSAPGFEGATASVEVVVDRRFWPRAGMTLPARFSRTEPRTLDWDVLARSAR